MPAGPMFRGFQFLNCSSETFCADADMTSEKDKVRESNDLINANVLSNKLKDKLCENENGYEVM
jgi:hypothetical protein